jgi:hypothetical protein
MVIDSVVAGSTPQDWTMRVFDASSVEHIDDTRGKSGGTGAGTIELKQNGSCWLVLRRAGVDSAAERLDHFNRACRLRSPIPIGDAS